MLGPRIPQRTACLPDVEGAAAGTTDGVDGVDRVTGEAEQDWVGDVGGRVLEVVDAQNVRADGAV